MASVTFTANLQRHVECPRVEADGATVREVLDAVFLQNERARSYILDDQNALRPHIAVFVDSEQIRDRVRLSDPVSAHGEIHVMQALSGG